MVRKLISCVTWGSLLISLWISISETAVWAGWATNKPNQSIPEQPVPPGPFLRSEFLEKRTQEQESVVPNPGSRSDDALPLDFLMISLLSHVPTRVLEAKVFFPTTRYSSSQILWIHCIYCKIPTKRFLAHNHLKIITTQARPMKQICCGQKIPGRRYFNILSAGSIHEVQIWIILKLIGVAPSCWVLMQQNYATHLTLSHIHCI